MIAELIAVIAPIFVCAGIGLAWARFGPAYDTAFVTTLVINVGTPCLVFATLTGLEVSPLAFAEIGLFALGALACFALFGAAVLRLAGLPFHTYLPALMFGNIGNMGLPLALFAFGEPGLGLAIAYFTVSAVANFTIGNWLSAGVLSPRTALNTPLMYAVALSVAVMLIGLPVPRWIDNTVHLLGDLTIPLMLITLGVSLAQLRVVGLWRASALSLLRLAMGFAVGYAIAEGFALEGAMRGVLILMSSMPVAVFNYLFAARNKRDAGEVAGMVLVSTLVSFATLPLLLVVVL
ncbi:MAG: AEC family transporter [Alphaproteobacteria bacterium]|nr:AEC family transporter [Alphaproteobacteria bacterium]